jgi:hypothetical protein
MDDSDPSSPGPEEVLTHLLGQPPEIVGEVLQWLDLRDLLSLRIANRKLHELVHHHEKSICARFCRRLQRENCALQLPVKIHGLTNDLLFYIELQRRYTAIRELAHLLCTHIVSRIQFRHPGAEKEELETWRSTKVSKMHRLLFPALFLLNNFLECLHSVFLSGEEDFANWDDDMLLSLHDVYDLDQQRIIEDFSPCDEETIQSVTAIYAILLGVLKARKLSLGSKSPKYPFASLKRIMLSCGLLPFPDILKPSNDDTDRRYKLIQASEDVWYHKARKFIESTVPRLRSIHHLKIERVHYLGEIARNRSHNARNCFVERQDIWNKAAFAVFQRLGSSESFPSDTDEWIKHAIVEPGDPTIDLGDWKAPDPT